MKCTCMYIICLRNILSRHPTTVVHYCFGCDKHVARMCMFSQTTTITVSSSRHLNSETIFQISFESSGNKMPSSCHLMAITCFVLSVKNFVLLAVLPFEELIQYHEDLMLRNNDAINEHRLWQASVVMTCCAYFMLLVWAWGWCLLDLFFSFNELRWNAVSPTCLWKGRAILLLPHVGLLVTLPGLCGQPVQRADAHLLYNFMQERVDASTLSRPAVTSHTLRSSLSTLGRIRWHITVRLCEITYLSLFIVWTPHSKACWMVLVIASSWSLSDPGVVRRATYGNNLIW